MTEELQKAIKDFCHKKTHKIYHITHTTAHGSYFLVGMLALHSIEPWIYALLFVLLIIGVLLREEVG